ncbi:MAG: hypothetical protein ACTSQI_19195 [Candidatus Helarchaeota archaeon]
MDTAPLIGVIICLISGLFILIQCFLVPFHDATWIINLVVAIVIIAGSLIGLAAPPVGGGIVMIIAGFVLIMGIISYFSDNPIFLQYSFLFDTVFKLQPGGMTAEAFIAILGSEILVKTS